jgi:activating signal cointegrator 1
MRAISLWQPWASLWCSEDKEHETRHWSTAYRGPLLVHAAQKLVSKCGLELDDIVIARFGPHWRTTLPRGAIIGKVALINCVPTETMPASHQRTNDYQCGDFSPRRFAWRRTNYRLFEAPIPYRGRQSFFDVPDSILPRAAWQ